MFCRHCGSEVRDNAKFCTNCGSKIERKNINLEQINRQEVTSPNTFPQQPAQAPPQQAPRQYIPPQPPPYQPAAYGGGSKSLGGRTALIIILLIALVLGLGFNVFQFINGTHIFSGSIPGLQKTGGVASHKDPDPASIIKTEKWGYVPANQIIIVFHDEVDRASAKEIIDQSGGSVVGELEFINLYQLETDDKSESELNAKLDALSAMEGVELVFPNVPAYGSDLAGQPCTPLQDPTYADPSNSHYKLIGMEEAWKIIKGSGIKLNKVNVGVLDEAFYSGSEEFKGSVKLSGDKTNDPVKRNGQIVSGGLSHGSKVAHVIGADAENGGMVGVAGVLEENLAINVKNVFDANPQYTAIQPDADDLLQISYPSGVAYTDKTLVYLKKMVDEGALVINCSFNFRPPSDNYEPIVKAYTKFFKKMQETNPNVVFVASAGNAANAEGSRGALNGRNDCPAGIKLPNVITVGAINNDGSRAEFSGFATEDAEVTLSAPGVEMIVGTDENGLPIKASGTSFSAPQVTAAIALVQSISPGMDAAQIKDLLVQTAANEITTDSRTMAISSEMGKGVLRVDEAVLQAINNERYKEGKIPYSMQELLDRNAVDLFAETGFREYTVRASVPDAEGSSVSLKLEVTGKCSIEEDTVQSVQIGEEAVWNLTIEDDSVFVRVVRTDTEGCAFVTLKIYESVSGIYEVKGVWDSGDGPEPLTDWRARVEDMGDGEMTITFYNSAGTVLTGSYDEISGIFIGIDRNKPADIFAFTWWMGDETTITFDFDSIPMTAKGTLTYDWRATATVDGSDSNPVEVELGPPTKVDFEMIKVEELPR
ncbi:MAG: S8 family serine peptidase [Eubacteriales bacterium]|nr:S8 family serine peptidase [Eubacteriales bacterium]MDD4540867.1 S8 family serine peptidase [Eubacteriales bacterium]